MHLTMGQAPLQVLQRQLLKLARLQNCPFFHATPEQQQSIGRALKIIFFVYRPASAQQLWHGIHEKATES